MKSRVFALFALLAPFLFPWPYTVGITVVAAFWYPPVALAVGIISDALYYTHGASGLPLGTLWGIAGTVCMYALRRIAHTYLRV